MFGLFGILAKSISDQIADYAVAQADVARRAVVGWQETMTAVQPVRIETASAQERRLRRLAMQKAAARRY